jgi:hypothetical protein
VGRGEVEGACGGVTSEVATASLERDGWGWTTVIPMMTVGMIGEKQASVRILGISWWK